MGIRQILHVITAEIEETLAGLKEGEFETLIDAILEAKRLFFVGQGRSGLIARAGAMRLMHIGLKVYVVGESVTPSISQDDMLIAVSSSGTTQITYSIAQTAKNIGAKVVAITSRRDSPLGNLSDIVVEIPCPSKESQANEKRSVQFSSTLFEQVSLLYLDAVALSLVNRLRKSEEEMMSRHSNLE